MTTTEATPNPFQSARILLKELQEKFTVFGEFLPLAIGIDKQLIAQSPDVSRKALRTALGIHTNSLRYLKGMEKATVRFNLDGSNADEVTDVHRAHATTTLKERFKKNAEQRKAQRQVEETQRKAEAAQKQVAEAELQRAEKLSQLAEKFSRKN
ncbi:ProQ/FINO family protein [Herminiimonas sp.]|uniref:ProQ/FINO family protein n=1 Tax=Herminiimonas sp. TaxID=1926289 RepID=UPI0027201257|nr:ProQ/FINO family protein [Herminiimonas sp.]MDO8305775.1 ProQ/FINO family protein [Herminiimonas sp.]